MFRFLRQSVAFVALFAGTGLITTTQLEAADEAVHACNHCNQGRRGWRGLRGHGHGHHNNCQNCRPYQYGNPDLFANYYVPGTCGGVPAQMYVAPHPVPPNVMRTYITYQPFMPHEMLYKHHRSYHRYYDGGRGLTRTKVTWW